MLGKSQAKVLFVGGTSVFSAAFLAFAVAREAATHLPAMFTCGGHDIIRHAAGLTGAICRVFARLLAR